ncbi:hypothetical protein [Halomonas sp. C05BenzN]|uniref:hypothetical protein n=1 Tax=Halomonas sp. C05BenzN TaxID=3411041 RepID=UPI003B925F47
MARGLLHIRARKTNPDVTRCQQQQGSRRDRPFSPTRTTPRARDAADATTDNKYNGGFAQALRVNKNNSLEAPEPSGRDAPDYGNQQEQVPSRCTPGNNTNKPGGGILHAVVVGLLF